VPCSAFGLADVRVCIPDTLTLETTKSGMVRAHALAHARKRAHAHVHARARTHADTPVPQVRKKSIHAPRLGAAEHEASDASTDLLTYTHAPHRTHRTHRTAPHAPHAPHRTARTVRACRKHYSGLAMLRKSDRMGLASAAEYTHAHTHTDTHTRTHVYTHAHTQTHTHAHTFTRTHTRTHTG
jgi:hypothetical protein